MGGITSQPLRILRNWNVENRAFRVLDKQKVQPKAAPRYPTEEKALTKRARQAAVAEGNPIPGLETEKEPHLDKWLRTVKVNSQDVPSSRLPLFQENESVAIERDPRKDSSSSRPLPEERQTLDDPEYGFPEPAKVMPGKLTFRNAMELMALAQHDPVIYTPEHLATVYKMQPHDVRNILQHFRVFTLFIPKTKTAEEQRVSLKSALIANESLIKRLEAANASPQDERNFLEGDETYKVFLEGRRQLAEEAAVHPERTLGAQKYDQIKKEQDKILEDEKKKYGRVGRPR